MPFTGTYARSIDEKLRIAIPKPVRAELGELGGACLYVAPGTDGCVNVYTESDFARLAEQLAAVPPAAENLRAFSRLFYGQAQRIEIDRQGRVRIPADLAQWAGLQRDAILVGVRDHLELWDRRQWDDYRTQLKPRYDEIAAAAFRREAQAGP
jgi:MraZ protein